MKFLKLMLTGGLVALGGCSTLPPTQVVATPDATHSYVLSGAGAPAVILESGLGDGKQSWSPVYEQIARITKVFAYDRSGYGSSKSAHRSRDGATIVRELRATLHALELEPPYVLVGHSIGGTYMELYARTYPAEVAGVVLVDSRHADFSRQCQVAKARPCTPPAIMAALMPAGPRQELAAGDQTMADVMRAGPFPDVPLRILTSGKKMFGVDAKFHEVWLETQESLATLGRKSEQTVCRHCGHYVHKDNPELVVAAVESVVREVQALLPNGRR